MGVLNLLRHLGDPSLHGGAVSIGNFDGVHRGHVRLVERLKRRAADLAGPSVVLTFDPHPVRLLRPEAAPPPLTWTARKAELLGELGVDAMVAYPTDDTLLHMSPEEFFDRIICGALQAKALVEGPNFFFGRGRAGDVRRLGELCQARSMALEIVEPDQIGGELVSSSRIRTAVQTGDVGLARRMLTRPYRVRGVVAHGAARGARIGFPTANLDGVDTLVPARGVYAGRAIVQDQIWPAAIHIGPSPTFGDQILRLETHLIGFTGSLYGQLLEVDFLDRLRDIRPFASVEELRAQLESDIRAAARVVHQLDT